MTGERLSRQNVPYTLTAAPLIILDQPQMGENIGAAARAMLNFGISGLRLVNPRDGWPNPKAMAMASGASVVIDGASVFDDVGASVADCDYVIATTARRRELALPVMTPQDAAHELRGRVDRGQRCAVLFGGERNGLASDDVARANAICSIPVNPAFASLNLASAVLLLAYEWAQSAELSVDNPMADERLATHDDVNRLYEHLTAELDSIGYFFPEQMREGMMRNLRVTLVRAGFTQSEVHTLRGVVKALARARK